MCEKNQMYPFRFARCFVVFFLGIQFVTMLRPFMHFDIAMFFPLREWWGIPEGLCVVNKQSNGLGKDTPWLTGSPRAAVLMIF